MWRRTLRGAVAGAGMFVLFGVDPNSDVLAHFGGFVTGAAIGGALAMGGPDPANYASILERVR